MLQFADGYKKDLLTIVLVNNYRSTQHILNVSKTLINGNEERLVKQIEGLSKDLVASNHIYASLEAAQPELLEYQTQRDEMIGTVLKVEELVKSGVPGNHIGIIYRENKYGDELTQYLRLKGLPYYSKRSLNILDQPIIQQVLLVLEYIAAEHEVPYSGDEMLFHEGSRASIQECGLFTSMVIRRRLQAPGRFI
jgi:DNA helicase-2/ATP-dependent DNA helicase PcrA